MTEHTPLHNALTERGFALVMDGSGMNARWRHPDPQVDGLLLSITLAAESAAISVYFADHHADYVRPKYVAILMRLRAMARHGRDPRPSLARLANAIGMKEDAVRQFVRWWGTPQPDDPEWRVMRAYIPFIGAADGKSYRFSVLQGDVPDEATWEIFDRQRAQLVLRLSDAADMGSENQTDMGSEKESDMGSEKESDMGSVFQTGLKNRPHLSQKRGLKNRPPSEPCARAHDARTGLIDSDRLIHQSILGTGSGTIESADPDADPESRTDDDSLHSQLGIPRSYARKWRAAGPDALAYGIRFVRDYYPVWERIAAKAGKPVGQRWKYIERSVQNAIDLGDFDAPPWYQDAIKPPRDVRPASASPAPAKPAPVVSDPELAAAWSEVLTEATRRLGKETVETWLADTALRRHGAGLAIVATSSTVSTWITKKYLPQLSAIVADVLGEPRALTVILAGARPSVPAAPAAAATA